MASFADPIPPGHGEPENVGARPGDYCVCGRPRAGTFCKGCGHDFYPEPTGAGADPFGRPDPRTHPEFWTE